MVFSNILLRLSILLTLSAATLWQNSTECTDAVSEFSQQSTCFGSAAGKKAWQQIMFTVNEGTFASHLELHHSPGLTKGLISFYNSFCISQTCVNLYATVVEKCFVHVQEKLNLDLALLVDQLVNYSCSANGLGEYCATALLGNTNTDFKTVVACATNQSTTLPSVMDVNCNSACQSLLGVTSLMGCCVNNYFDTLETMLTETGISSYPDTSGIWSDCDEADPGTCPTQLINPLRSSGHHTRHSLQLGLLPATGLLVAILAVQMGEGF